MNEAHKHSKLYYFVLVILNIANFTYQNTEEVRTDGDNI